MKLCSVEIIERCRRQMLLQIWKKYGFVLLLLFIIGGFYSKIFALIAVICMLGPIVLALLGYGRLWCKNICPRGNFYDRVIYKYCSKKPNPKLIKSTVFKIAVILFIFIIFGASITKYWEDIKKIGSIFHRMIIATTLVGIILAFIFNHRTWCCLCPMGSISLFISKYKKNRR